MILSQAIWISLEPLYIEGINEKDNKKLKEIKKKINTLKKEYNSATDYELNELKKEDILGTYDELKPRSKKIISKEQYTELMNKWSNIVGEKLLYPEEQRYLDAKKLTLKSIDFMSPEEQKAELDRFEYNWLHRKERDQLQLDLKNDAINYAKMINSMTSEEQDEYYNLRNQDESRKTLYKNTYTVKTNDEE